DAGSREAALGIEVLVLIDRPHRSLRGVEAEFDVGREHELNRAAHALRRDVGAVGGLLAADVLVLDAGLELDPAEVVDRHRPRRSQRSSVSAPPVSDLEIVWSPVPTSSTWP